MDSQITQVPETQFPSNEISKTKFEYDQVVFFNWAPGLRTPFKLYRRSLFDTSEIREEYYLYQIPPNSRLRKLKKLKSFPGESLSMFAKVERSI